MKSVEQKGHNFFLFLPNHLFFSFTRTIQNAYRQISLLCTLIFIELKSKKNYTYILFYRSNTDFNNDQISSQQETETIE